MTMNTDLISQLVDILRQNKAVLGVYFIGSSAHRKTRKESDFDLAVLVDDRRLLNEDKVYELIRNLSFPKDLDLSVVDSKSSPLFLFEMVSRGQRIFTRSEEEIAAFAAYVLHKYYDTNHIRKIYYSYLKDKFSYAN